MLLLMLRIVFWWRMHPLIRKLVSQVTVEDHIFLITIEDDLMHSMTDVKAEVHRLMKDTSIKGNVFSIRHKREGKDRTSPRIPPHLP